MIELGNRVFVQDTKNWQVSHSWPIREHARQPVPDRPRGRPSRSERHRLPPGGRGLPRRDGHVHGHPRRPARVSEHRDDRLLGHGRRRQRLHRQQSADVGHQQHDDVGQRKPHAELRRQLPPLVAPARSGHGVPRQLRVTTSASPAIVVADMLLGYYSGVGIFQPAAFSVPGAAGNPREFNFKYFAPYFQDDWRVNSRLTVNLGLRWDYRNVPVRNPQSHGLAQPGLRARRPAGGRRVPRRRRHRRRRLLPVRGSAQPREPGSVQGVRAADRDLPGGRSASRPSSAAATACSSTRRRAARSTAPPTSIRTSAAATTSSPIGQPTPLQTTDSLFPSFAAPGRGDTGGQHVPGGQPVTRAEEPLRAAVVARRAARAVAAHHDGAQLHRHARLQSADAAQHRPGAAVRSGQPAVGRTRASRIPNFIVYIDSDWSGRSNYNALNTKLEHRGRGAILTFAYTWAKSTDSKSAAAGHRRQRVQRLAGLPEQPRSRARLRAVGLRRRSSARRQLRLQPALRQRREVRGRRDRREERGRRRLAGQRHLHLAARLPDHDHGCRSRRPQRHVRHQSRRSGRRSERRTSRP